MCDTEALLSDHTIELIVNLTTPNSHFEVSKMCLEAGKHVYSEKPLMVTFQSPSISGPGEPQRSLFILGPCVFWVKQPKRMEALRDNEIGTVRVFMLNLMTVRSITRPNLWRKPSGAPFLYRDEFQVGFPIYMRATI